MHVRIEIYHRNLQKHLRKHCQYYILRMIFEALYHASWKVCRMKSR